jgi:hypothetical protein
MTPRSKKPSAAKQSASKGRSSIKTKTPAKKSSSSADTNALRGLAKNPPVRDVNPAAAYSTSPKGRDSDPSRQRVKPRRG